MINKLDAVKNCKYQHDLFDNVEIMVNDNNLGIKFFDKSLIDEYWNKWQSKLSEWRLFSIKLYGFILTDLEWWRSRFNDDFVSMPTEHFGIFGAILKLYKTQILEN